MSRARDDADTIAKTFRPSWKPLALPLAANLTLAALLLGWPYLRGRSIAHDSRAKFAELAQCLLGGTALREPGLALPSGDRDHFAARVLQARSDWPLRCRAPLRALAPPEATFLWPSVKQAGADVRAVVRLLDGELVALHRARRSGRASVPLRPLDALAKLQAALALLAQAGDAQAHVDHDAIRLHGAGALVSPARLPLAASASSLLTLDSRAGALDAIALDGRGVSWLRVADGKIDRERVKRSVSLRSSLRVNGEPFLVWATAEARCAEREDRCASRATGLAPHDKGGGDLALPVWLAGHPFVRPDRALHVEPDGRVVLLARTAEGAVAVRHFTVDFRLPRDDHAAPLQPTAEQLLEGSEGALDAVLLRGARAAVFTTERAEGLVPRLVSLREDRAVHDLPASPGTAGWLAACDAADAVFVAYGTDAHTRLVRVAPNAPPRTLSESHTEPPARPSHAEDPAADPQRLLCTTRGPRLLTRGSEGTLALLACDAHDGCLPRVTLGRSVDHFSAATLRDALVVATSSASDGHAIRVTHVAESGVPVAGGRVVAACFEPARGFCGAPAVTSDHSRVVVIARDGEDLLAIETSDGRRYEALTGVQAKAAADPNATDAMRQHRVRKGLD